MARRVLMILAIGCWLFPGSRFAFADVYQWMDEKGSVHFTDSYDAVPERYRDQVEKKSKPEEPTPEAVKLKTKKREEAQGKTQPKKGRAEKEAINKNKIESEVEDSLRTIISLWKEGKFAALYDDYGTIKSKTAIAKEVFERKMARKLWKFATSWETIQDIRVEVKTPKSTYATAKLGFKLRIGVETRTRTVTYPMSLERGGWKVDLQKILNTTD